MKYLFIIISIALLFAYNPSVAQTPNLISMEMETNRVHQGKLVKVIAEILYKPLTGELITHYKHPMEYVVFSNKLGEAKIYYPTRNEVEIKQNQFFSSENSLIHHFFTNASSDFGLTEMGFSINDTRFEEDLMITTWYPPAQMLKQFSGVEMVYQNNLPIYSAYFNSKQNIIRKVFYAEYSQNEYFALPCKITEYSYPAPNDSIVSRMVYKDINYNKAVSSPYVDFKIPEDAKLIK